MAPISHAEKTLPGSHSTILVIDDDVTFNNVVHDFLCADGYQVITADDPNDGLKRLRQNNIDLVITDLMMPKMSGIDVLKNIQSYDPEIPVIMITGYPSVNTAIKAVKEGGIDFITKPFKLDHARLVVKKALEVARLTKQNKVLNENLTDRVMQSITSLIKTIDARDNYTMDHSKRVTTYAINLARHLGCSDDEIDALQFAGPIHDVGKIGIRDNILLKPGKLAPEEREIMDSHATIGDDIIKPLCLGPLEHAIVRNHHERFDGEGYPDKLEKDKIPLVARIFSVMDAYDAMTTNRPYRSTLGHEKAVAELKRCRGSQFDGEIVDTFIECDIYKEKSKAA